MTSAKESQPYPSWVLDEATGIYNAPIHAPRDGLMYKWNEPTVSWIIVEPQPPAHPNDGKKYRYDPFTNNWVSFE